MKKEVEAKICKAKLTNAKMENYENCSRTLGSSLTSPAKMSLSLIFSVKFPFGTAENELPEVDISRF